VDELLAEIVPLAFTSGPALLLSYLLSSDCLQLFLRGWNSRIVSWTSNAECKTLGLQACNCEPAGFYACECGCWRSSLSWKCVVW